MSNTKSTRAEFLAPIRLRVNMDEMIAEEMRSQNKSEEEINDYLQQINEECDD